MRKTFTDEACELSAQFIAELCAAVPELDGAEVVFFWNPKHDNTNASFIAGKHVARPDFQLRALQQRLKIVDLAAGALRGMAIDLEKKLVELNQQFIEAHGKGDKEKT